MDNNECCYIAFDPKEEHMALIESINALSGEQDVGQQAPLQHAIAYLLQLKEELNEQELTRILKVASKTTLEVRPGISVPRSIKAWVRKSELETVEEIFRKAFNILRLQRPFFVRVLLTSFYLHLREENRKLGVSETPIPTSIENENDLEAGINNLLRFQVSVDVSDMMLRNASEDTIYIKEIFEIMRRRGERH